MKRRSPSAWLAMISALASAVVIVPSVSAAPAHAAGPSYLALGDSYSSGTGTRRYVADGTSCQRSVYAYPALVANARGLSLLVRACSGATVADVASLQVPALGSDTRFVTVSVGGNDAGFASVLTECAMPGWMSNCPAKVDAARATVTNTLPGRLDALYTDIAARAPQAKVVVVGYPRLFNGTDCNAFTWFSGTEMRQLNAASDLLNATTEQAAARHGFSFVQPTNFSGHAVCDTPEWLNGLSNPISESFHPNTTGHSSGYQPLVLGLAPSSPLAHGQTLGVRSLQAQGRRYATVDARIKPKSVQAVNLHSPRARAAAAKAGVNLNSRASIDRVDARYSAAQAANWSRAAHSKTIAPR